MRASSCACMKRFSKIVSDDNRDSLGLRHQRHVLRLQVGGEAGILFGGHIDATQPSGGPDAQRSVIGLCHFDAALLQLGHERAHDVPDCSG